MLSGGLDHFTPILFESLRQYVAYLVCRVFNQLFRGVPIDTGIGYRDTVFQLRQIFRNTLATPVDITLKHQGDDGFVAVDDLIDTVFCDQGLVRRVLAGIAMTTIDGDIEWQFGRLQGIFGLRNTHRIVIMGSATAAQYHVTVLIALGMEYCALTLLVNPQEVVIA